MNIKKLFAVFLITLLISINSVCALEWYNVSDLSEEEKTNVEKTKILKSEYDYPNTFKQVDIGSNFYRYKIFCNAELNKCGLYDKKKDKFTGYKYNYKIEARQRFIDGSTFVFIDDDFTKGNEIISDTFSGVPSVIENGKKVCVQPFKRIGNSTVRGVYYTVYGIVILPVAIPYGIVWLIVGHEDSKTAKKIKEKHATE